MVGQGEREVGACVLVCVPFLFFARSCLLFVFTVNGCLPLLLCICLFLLLYVYYHSVEMQKKKKSVHIIHETLLICVRAYCFFFSCRLFLSLLAMAMKREDVKGNRWSQGTRYRTCSLCRLRTLLVTALNTWAPRGEELGLSRALQPSSGLCFPCGVVLRSTCLSREIRQGC